MSNRTKGPKTDMQKKLEAIGFNGSSSSFKKNKSKDDEQIRISKLNEQKKDALKRKIKAQFNRIADDSLTLEQLHKIYIELEARKKQELKRKIEFDFNYKAPDNLDLEQLKKLRSELFKIPKKKKNTRVSIDAIKSTYGSTEKITKTPDTTNLKKIGIDDFEEYKFLEINHHSTINSNLIQEIAPEKINVEQFSSRKTQKYNNSINAVELVMGIDFGTTNTKVVIQETGSEKSWAIPFSNKKNNPYLLPSNIFLTKDIYTLDGGASCRINDLKLPLIKGSASNEHLDHVIAYIALVIRHARSWFLDNAAESFYGFEFEWFYKMGLPAENNDNKKLVSTYKSTLTNAVKLSLADQKQINQKEIDHLLESSIAEDISEYCDVHPEIQAQLEGYTKSDKWDSKRVKVMMVDIGGGTVDASIINVTRDGYEDKYNCLKTKVDSLGVYILHLKRLEWLEMSAQKSEHDTNKLLSEINSAKNLSGSLPIFPETVEDYISNVAWPEGFSIDNVFFNAFHSLIYTDIISDVKTRIDINNLEQWKNLCFILCGGGSLHPMFNQIESDPNLDIVRLQKPSVLKADIPDQEYHRISVAYGLSFMEQGQFINASEIEPMKKEKKNYLDNYIDKDMM